MVWWGAIACRHGNSTPKSCTTVVLREYLSRGGGQVDRSLQLLPSEGFLLGCVLGPACTDKEELYLPECSRRWPSKHVTVKMCAVWGECSHVSCLLQENGEQAA